MTEPERGRRRGGLLDVIKSLLKDPGAALGLVIVVTLAIVALLAPVLAPFEPTQMGAGSRLEPPSAQHLFGTDEFGRDILSRVIHGARLTMQIGLIAVGISLSVGTVVGLLSAYVGGWLEGLLMRGVDVLFSFTETLIALAAVAVLGPSLQNAMIAVGIAAIPFYARIAHSAALVEKNKPYFEATQAVGAGHQRVLLRHLLPNIAAPMIIVSSLGVSIAILAAAALSFLGLGAQPPSPEWGSMLSAGRDFFTRAPWLMIFPGVAITVTVLGFNLLGDGLQEALDPR